MLNLCWSITKRFLNVLVIFEKYFVFAKIVKNSIIVLPCSGDSVAGRTSRMPQLWVHNRDFSRLVGDSLAGKCFSCEKDLEYFSKIWNFMLFVAQVGDLFAGGRSSHEGYIEIFAAQFATCLRVEGLVARGTQRFSRLSSRLSRKWNFQSRKTLKIFFQKFSFKCFGS